MENVNSQYGQKNVSIYKYDDGRIGMAVSLGSVGKKRNRIAVTGKTEEEAKIKLYNRLVEAGAIEPPAIVVNDLSPVENLIMEFKQKDILSNTPSKKKGARKKPKESRTKENYLDMLSYFEEHFKGYTVQDITAHEINKFFKKLINDKKKDGTPRMSQVTLNKIEYIIDRMYKRAAEEKRFISNNPLSDEGYIRPISLREQEEVTPLSEEEMQMVLYRLRDNIKLYTPILLLATTGMRIEEVLALRWKHLDMDKQNIQVRGAITTDTNFDMQGKKISRKTVQKDTKTYSSKRDVYMVDETKECLLVWKSECKKVSQTRTGQEDFVFGNSKGPSWTYSGFRSSINKALPMGLRFHRIRHYVGTLMATEHAGSFNIMSQLGHAKESTTRRYIGYTDRSLSLANGKIIAGKVGGIMGKDSESGTKSGYKKR